MAANTGTNRHAPKVWHAVRVIMPGGSGYYGFKSNLKAQDAAVLGHLVGSQAESALFLADGKLKTNCFTGVGKGAQYPKIYQLRAKRKDKPGGLADETKVRVLTRGDNPTHSVVQHKKYQPIITGNGQKKHKVIGVKTNGLELYYNSLDQGNQGSMPANIKGVFDGLQKQLTSERDFNGLVRGASYPKPKMFRATDLTNPRDENSYERAVNDDAQLPPSSEQVLWELVREAQLKP